MDDIDALVGRLMADVLAHTARYPKASDTIDGISKWWLRAGESASRGVLLIALERLVASGRLQRTIGPDGAVRYSARTA